MRLVISLTLCAVLAACGGGGGANLAPQPLTPDAPAFTAQQAQQALQAVIPDGVSSTWEGLSVDALNGEEEPLALVMSWPEGTLPSFADGRWRFDTQKLLDGSGAFGGPAVSYFVSAGGAVSFSYTSREGTLAHLYQERFWVTQERWEGAFNGGALTGSYHTHASEVDLASNRKTGRTRGYAHHTFTLTRR